MTRTCMASKEAARVVGDTRRRRRTGNCTEASPLVGWYGGTVLWYARGGYCGASGAGKPKAPARRIRCWMRATRAARASRARTLRRAKQLRTTEMAMAKEIVTRDEFGQY
jgi:hypothetical protein